MLEWILAQFFGTAGPLITAADRTQSPALELPYRLYTSAVLGPILNGLYWRERMREKSAIERSARRWAALERFGYDAYNQDSIHFDTLRLPGTGHYHNYFHNDLPPDLNHAWKKDKVHHAYIQSILRANLDYINVPLGRIAPIRVLDDQALYDFVVTTQLCLYLEPRGDRQHFDSEHMLYSPRFPNVCYEATGLSFVREEGPASLQVHLVDGTTIAVGDDAWDLAKTTFLSNTFIFMVLCAHLHHHLFFPEVGAAFVYNYARRDEPTAFGKLMAPHTAYTICLNKQFKSEPLSMRETPGQNDKYLYSSAGHVTGETFFHLGYSNALYMYYGRRLDGGPPSYLEKHDLRFDLPMRRYLDGDFPFHAFLKELYDETAAFMGAVVPVLREDPPSRRELDRWTREMIYYFEWDKQDYEADPEAFCVTLLATYVWFVSFVHSLDHYWFYRLVDHYCLFCRKPFHDAKTLPFDQVFSQYDLWKSRHIVETFGRNHPNPDVIENYLQLDYGFTDPRLVDAQERFKNNTHAILENRGVPGDFIAPSIRF
jgi:hypothetical protein